MALQLQQPALVLPQQSLILGPVLLGQLQHQLLLRKLLVPDFLVQLRKLYLVLLGEKSLSLLQQLNIFPQRSRLILQLAVGFLEVEHTLVEDVPAGSVVDS